MIIKENLNMKLNDLLKNDYKNYYEELNKIFNFEDDTGHFTLLFRKETNEYNNKNLYPFETLKTKNWRINVRRINT